MDAWRRSEFYINSIWVELDSTGMHRDDLREAADLNSQNNWVWLLLQADVEHRLDGVYVRQGSDFFAYLDTLPGATKYCLNSDMSCLDPMREEILLAIHQLKLSACFAVFGKSLACKHLLIWHKRRHWSEVWWCQRQKAGTNDHHWNAMSKPMPSWKPKPKETSKQDR